LVVHYNVENLFDTIDDPHKNDNMFLPSSKKSWTSERYWVKQEHLANVLHKIDPKKLPDLVSLVEIENLLVLQDLVKQKEIAKANYKIVHRESPDERGIDCALLYNPKSFKLISSQFIRVSMADNKNFKTRDILYAKGLSLAKDTLHVFVNHWPSRLGGMEKSEPKRMLAAQILRNTIDSILSVSPNAKLLILGDFNDETDNKSITEILGAKDQIGINNSLFNMAAKQDKQSIGTYYYHGDKEWNMIDQMIVSSTFYANKGLQIKSQEINIFNPDWLLLTEKDGNKTPNKTFGKDYYGGYSDHLPFFQYLYYQCKE